MERERRPMTRGAGWIACLGALITVSALAYGPLVERHFDRYAELHGLHEAPLVAIELIPDHSDPATPSLVQETLRIEHPAALSALTSELRGARQWHDLRGEAVWRCLVSMDFGDHTTIFHLRGIDGGAALAAITTSTGVRWRDEAVRWRLGTLRLEGVREVLRHAPAGEVVALTAPR